MNSTLRKYLIVALTTLAAAVCLPLTTRRTEVGHPPVRLRCVIDLKGEPVRGLTVGMNKIILREFADDHGLDIEFITPADSANYLDSLREETVDLLVMFRADSLHRDGFLSTLPYRDSTVWVVRDDRGDAVRRLNAWISAMYCQCASENMLKLYIVFRQKSNPNIMANDHNIPNNIEFIFSCNFICFNYIIFMIK